MAPYHILGAAASVWCACIAPVKAEDYVVRWSVVEHDVSPTPQVVSQGYVARFSYDGSHFVTAEGGETAEAVAGQPVLFVTKLGTQHTIVSTVGGRSIVRTDTFPGFSMAIRIQSYGTAE